LPFADPDVEERKLVAQMNERILGTGDRRPDINPNDVERSTPNLVRFLRKNNHDFESAWAQWMSWVKWRKGKKDQQYKTTRLIYFQI
jgi:hypothetical protein